MDIPDCLPPSQYVIYALVDPTDEKVYYVGQTRNPQKMPLLNREAQPRQKHAGRSPTPVAEVRHIQTSIAGARLLLQ